MEFPAPHSSLTCFRASAFAFGCPIQKARSLSCVQPSITILAVLASRCARCRLTSLVVAVPDPRVSIHLHAPSTQLELSAPVTRSAFDRGTASSTPEVPAVLACISGWPACVGGDRIPPTTASITQQNAPAAAMVKSPLDLNPSSHVRVNRRVDSRILTPVLECANRRWCEVWDRSLSPLP
jgi:hypothetical protein